ncbi:tyrosine-type recombinase/integrase [Rhizobium sp. RU36D]|uniref:tyrosine-type recombinase/integrase n=1 Tax=Rhizobium sp. RU36D TaxID=1907415 RepID=UPI0009D80B2C|nr:tyrosine-type recombinase/integrase [Rhizobium sp. RU36D]SMD20337.1 Integrase [Rhizobium sp. RU36D]
MANALVGASPERFNSQLILPPSQENFAVPGEPTFAEAARHYLKGGGEARYLFPIIAYFGETPLKSIYPAHLRAMAEALYPNHKGVTKNRQALTPARAVILHGYEHGWCNRISIRTFKTEKPKRKKPASAIWLHSFMRQCQKDDLPHVAAIVMFMATTGARISEAVNLRWDQVDLTSRTALLLKTKTSTNSQRYLTDDTASRMRELQANLPDVLAELRGALSAPDVKPKTRRWLAREIDRHDRVFRFTSRHSVNERINAVCARADIPAKPPHTCGRHTYANWAIEMGLDITTAMKGGGWESTSVFLEIYVRPRENSGRIVADRFNLHDFTAL